MTSSDTLVLFVGENPKLGALLERMGYGVIVHDGSTPFPPVMEGRVIDGVIIDRFVDAQAGAVDRVDLCECIRNVPVTRETPILMHGVSEAEVTRLAEKRLSNIEQVAEGAGVGSLVAKIATAIRLRKMEGAEDAHASLAAANASLRDLNARFSAEREEARKIQESLLPRELPQDPRLEIAASYEPLDEVGGDWFCVQREEDGRFTIQIADVTGHGLAAAFIGTMTKLALTASPQLLPHERLAEMNRLMSPQLPEGRFVTIAAALYDPSSGVFDFARGGHPPALFYRAKDGSVEEVSGKGFAFGFFDTAQYTVEQRTLEPGDLVVFYTDGISEAQNRNMEQFGVARLREVVAERAGHGHVSEVLSGLYEKLIEFCDGRVLKDDVTLIALKRVSR